MTPLIREMVTLSPEPESAMWFDVGQSQRIETMPAFAFRLFDKRSEARHKQTRISKRVKYVRGFGGLLK